MTLSTSVERRRRFARRALLSVSTILCSGLSLALAASAQDAPPKTFAMTPTGINLLNLSYVNEVNDLSIGSLTLTRSYISGKVDSNQYFGYSWTHNFDIWARQYTKGALGPNAQNYTEIIVGRTTHRYYGLSNSAYPENDETGTTVTNDGGAMVFTDRDGTVYRFAGSTASQQISTITSPDGTALSFAYTSGKLKTVTSNRGYALVFDYAGSVVSAACGYNLSSTVVTTGTSCASAAVKTSYSYNGTNLVSSTDANGNSTQYAYTSYSNNNVPYYLTCITDPGATSCKVANTWKWRSDLGIYVVSQQTTADNSIWQFDCSCGATAKADPDEAYPVEWTSVTEPNGAGTYTEFTAGALSSHTDENGQKYPLEYFGRLPVSMTRPEGDKLVWSYNRNYAPSGRTLKAKPGSNLPDLAVESKTFPTSCTSVTCNEPITIKDANGNETDYGYTDFGSVDWAMQAPPSSSAARPLKLYSYVKKSANVSNGAGSLSPASTSVQLPSAETQCQTVAGVGPGQPSGRPTCDPNAPQVTTTYEYGDDGTADNLLPRGKVVTADGQSLRTCYQYDATGNKIAETSPRAGLTSCRAGRTNIHTTVY